MDINDIKIRAKKISELDNFFDLNLTPDQNSYIIIGYNNGTIKQNYKMPLSSLVEFISNNCGSGTIDENVLENKINEYFNNHYGSLIGPQGPQGNQGPQGDGANIDLDNIQSQIDNLQNLINRYHEAYRITYSLTNITSASTNPSFIGYDKSLTLNFIPNNGYIMPNTITVENCEYSYNKTNQSLLISNPTGDVIISMTGEIGHYLLTKSFTNINYTPIGTEYQNYTLGSSITYKLTPAENYILPESIESQNCSIQYTPTANRLSAYLTITCTGTGNMSVSASAISNITYYFGFISVDDTGVNGLYSDANDNVELTWRREEDDTIIGIDYISINSTNWMTSSTSCPFNINESFVMGNTVVFGKETILIVPEEFYNAEEAEFTNGTDTGYFWREGGFAPMKSKIYKNIIIDNINYVCVALKTGIKSGSSYIIK